MFHACAPIWPYVVLGAAIVIIAVLVLGMAELALDEE